MALRARVLAAVAAIAAITMVSAVAAAPAVAADPPSVNLVAGSKTLGATWGSFPFSIGETRSVHVVLPAELGGYDIRGLSWTLDGYGSGLTGSVGTGATSFDIALPATPPQSTPLALWIQTPNGSPGDHVLFSARLEHSVGGVGSAPQTAVTMNLQLANALSRGIHIAYTGEPSPVLLTVGRTLSLNGGVGFWSDGPGGVWKDTGSYGSASFVDDETGSEVGLTYGETFDGSVLALDIPTELTGFRSGTVRLTMSQDLGGVDEGTTIDFSIPVGIASPIATDRVDGTDRYQVAVNVAEKAYPSGAPVAYVVTGANFPDALSAGPAAAKAGGPLLLTPTDVLLPEVKDELTKLAPSTIVVVGGPASVSEAVFDELGTIADTTRISGADRYEVSRNLLAFAFPDGADLAYVATGANFPDALSAGAAAGADDAPVVLVNGGASALDPATKTALGALGLDRITVVGGPNSVSNSMTFSLASVAGVDAVTIYAGADRFAASANLNAGVFDSATRAFLVTGLKFPDALSGSAWAGSIDAPLYVSRPDCVPPQTLAAILQQGVTSVTLIGGDQSLTQAVAELKPC